MAANLDKSENSLTSVSTLTYLRGIDASGNSVKISTSDLASVLGGSTTGNTLLEACDLYTRFVSSASKYGCEKYVLSGTYTYTNAPVTKVQGTLFAEYYRNRTILTIISDNGVTYRENCVNSSWIGWKQVALDIPEFYKDYADLSSLASALGGFNIEFTPKPLQAEKTLLFTVERARPFVLVARDLGISGVAFGVGYSTVSNISVVVDLGNNLHNMLSIEGFDVYITTDNARAGFNYKWFYL